MSIDARAGDSGLAAEPASGSTDRWPERRAPELLRPLGAIEQLFSALTLRGPCQLSLVAHYDTRIEPRAMRGALDRLQRVQPLLGACIDRRRRPECWRTTLEPIPLHVCGPDGTWREQAAREQADPIDVERGPLVRCALLDLAGERSSILLTFAHPAADPRGGVRAVKDLTAIVNGRNVPIRSLPESQEDAVWAARPVPAMMSAADMPSEPGMGTPARLRPFDGAPSRIDATTMSRAATAELLAAARREAVTVHSCLVAAATAIVWEHGAACARVVTPLDLRPVFGLADEVATRTCWIRTGFARERRWDFWTVARAAAAAIGVRRDARLLRDRVMAMAAAPSRDPDAAGQELAVGAAADVVIANLGTLTFPDHGPARVIGLDGPVLHLPLRGAAFVGAALTGGRLHLVDAGDRRHRDLLPRIAAMLARAARCSRQRL